VTVVLDTNVMVAALATNGLCHEVLHRAIRFRILATSEQLLRELEDTLRDKFGMSPPTAAFLTAFRAATRLVDPEPLPTPVCRDRDDDLVLATAMAAGADMVVTGDQDLLVLKAYRRVAIVTPRAFIEALDRTDHRR
jgi:putative PIN family toxin of toxin-antitoxin system